MIERLENVGVVVEDLDAAVAFFVGLGMVLEGTGPVEGARVDRVVGLEGIQLDVAMVRTPDGHGRLELMRFRSPVAVGGRPATPANALGLRRILFGVSDIDGLVAGLRARGVPIMGELVQYEDSHKLCYVRGPEGIIVAFAERLQEK
ncbi:VOC family protein [Amycolatopsis sp., V23-08]|uniref:VOC family protein n=1 Tax=Amycolatopsis heterodermiae TaxID=3110235 RepID=A0ABU5QWJ8_9PSEU|nr:VOC family protein [Amycolatopsis sp., V23-08]MEA5358298.1 VOC family protein [Amycolatopsis sp., V23-08]